MQIERVLLDYTTVEMVGWIKAISQEEINFARSFRTWATMVKPALEMETVGWATQDLVPLSLLSRPVMTMAMAMATEEEEEAEEEIVVTTTMALEEVEWATAVVVVETGAQGTAMGSGRGGKGKDNLGVGAGGDASAIDPPPPNATAVPYRPAPPADESSASNAQAPMSPQRTTQQRTPVEPRPHNASERPHSSLAVPHSGEHSATLLKAPSYAGEAHPPRSQSPAEATRDFFARSSDNL